MKVEQVARVVKVVKVVKVGQMEQVVRVGKEIPNIATSWANDRETDFQPYQKGLCRKAI